MNKLFARLWNEPLWQAPTEGTQTPAPADAPAAETPKPAESLISGEAPAPASEAPAEAPAPLTAADLTLPEGMEIPEETLNEFLSILNDAEAKPADRATKLVSLQQAVTTKALEAVTQQLETSWTETQNQWRAEASALPEIGGKALPATLATIKKGLEAVGATKETFAALDLTGAGNHPEIIRMLHALTKPLAEGKPISGSPTRGPLTQAEKIFGQQKE